MLKNSFAKSAPMGWNSYDYYDTTVNEEQVKANAAYMAEHMKDSGWEYIVVDIEWYAKNAGTRRNEFQYIPFEKVEIDEYSRLLPDTDRFPSSANGEGFKPLADYVHSLGLKFGIHIMRGIPRIAAHLHTKVKGCDVTAAEIADPSSICGWNPDMYGVRNNENGQDYYDSLLEMYAGWGVDFIKCDDICNTNMYPHNPYSGRHEIEMIAAAIEKCGRPIVLSLSPGPALIEKAWHYEKYANMWRITDDFWDTWDLLKNMFYRCELWEKHVSEGCYPDCDMLPLGMLGKGFGKERPTNFNYEEQKTMMSLWCIFGSPLMIGAELTKLDDRTLGLLTNKEILAMLPPSCKPHQIERNNEKAVWTAFDSNTKERYIALFNLSDEEREVSAELNEIFIESENIDFKNSASNESDAVESSGNHSFKELWTGAGEKAVCGVLKSKIAAHGCKVYRVEG